MVLIRLGFLLYNQFKPGDLFGDTPHRVFTDQTYFMDLCRGEKAFCSSECRDKHIRSDDYKEKCASGALKPPLDYSVSPCSGPLVFFAGVAAA